MSNPYDFTSGYLGARQQILQEEQAADLSSYRKKALEESKAEREQKYGILGPLYGAHQDLYTQQARTARLSNDLTEKTQRGLVDPLLDRLINKSKKRGIGLNVDAGAPIDFSSISKGYSFGFKPDYSLVPGGSSASPTDARVEDNVDAMPPAAITGPANPERNARGVALPGFADGTQGGFGIRVPRPAPVQEAPVAAAPAAAPAPSAVETLAQEDPEKATTVVRNIFGASNKEFQQLMGAFTIMDFAKGKITSDQMLTNVENLRKMQAEGLGRATQEALLGNSDKAKALFGEYGDDDGADIKKFEKIQMKNPVPGAAKGTADTYDALRVHYNDGRSMVYDPRRLMAEAVSQHELQRMNEVISNNIRTNDAHVYSTDAMNARTREDRANRLRQQELDSDRMFMTLVSNDFKSEIDRQTKTLVDKNNIDAKLHPEQVQAAYDEIANRLRPVVDIANINIGVLGNKRATFGSTMAAIQNPQPALDQSGKPITKEANGQLFGLTVGGIYLPLNRPQQ